ncbi:MAG: type II secretion system F family protein [Phycisphaerales bacterium]
MSAATFEYRAIDPSGHPRRGTASASDRDAAYRQVVAMGLTPVSIKPVGARARQRSRRGGSDDLIQFTNQLSVMIEARIPIGDGLLGMAEQECSERVHRVVTDVAARVQAGEPIASSMSAHPEFFGPVYLECIRAAEKTGNMVKVLSMLSEMLERMRETQRQVKSALAYPLVVIGTLGIATGFLVVFAVPKFAKMFAAKGAELPFLTRVLMSVGTNAQQYWWAVLGLIGMGIWWLRRVRKNPSARARFEGACHRVPVLGTILRGLGIARFMRVLSLTLSSGIGLIESIEMAGRASGRPALVNDSRMLAEQVRRGGRLADALHDCQYVPSLAKRMLCAGEQSGELPRMCETLAKQYERDTSALTKNLGSIIEPVLVVLIAAVVLVIALAIFLPMWDLVKVMG